MNPRLAHLFRDLESGKPLETTSIVVPSLSFDPEELAKIPGIAHYEERLLFILARLRDPRARVIFLSSQPIHPDVVDYYLDLLDGVSARSARERLRLFCTFDHTARPLTEKILERPRLVQRIREAIPATDRAYLTCFNSTRLELELARKLDVPLNGVDPELLFLGTKSGSRKVFAEAGVEHPKGFEDLRSEEEVVDALSRLWRPGLDRAVVKLNDSFAGAGNAIFTYPQGLPESPEVRRRSLTTAVSGLKFTEAGQGHRAFFAKLEEMGGIVEEMVDGQEVRSPSVQMRVDPTGHLELVSTHDQILGGATGQTYSGCRFPADEAYRRAIIEAGERIGEVLARYGVISRFAVDFVVTRDDDGWRAWAIEINLRMGGTTVPFLALQFLTGGQLAPGGDLFVAPTGKAKFYRATDSIHSPAYHGLLPEDLMDISAAHQLRFSPVTQSGVLFHMMGALSEYGKVGLVAIGDSPEQADALFRRTVEVLDQETGGVGVEDGDSAGAGMAPRPDNPSTTFSME
ncbi:MAG: peptide ligase PGM1-related protein [Holophagales bacterium]|nr:peptide ligase PGM1-related protein [Holophagales bacterium]